MYSYEITFLGGSQIRVFATSPREAHDKAQLRYADLEVIRVVYLKAGLYKRGAA